MHGRLLYDGHSRDVESGHWKIRGAKLEFFEYSGDDRAAELLAEPKTTSSEARSRVFRQIVVCLDTLDQIEEAQYKVCSEISLAIAGSSFGIDIASGRIQTHIECDELLQCVSGRPNRLSLYKKVSSPELLSRTAADANMNLEARTNSSATSPHLGMFICGRHGVRIPLSIRRGNCNPRGSAVESQSRQVAKHKSCRA